MMECRPIWRKRRWRRAGVEPIEAVSTTDWLNCWKRIEVLRLSGCARWRGEWRSS